MPKRWIWTTFYIVLVALLGVALVHYAKLHPLTL